MALDDDGITALRATFAGEVLLPTDAGFAQARAEALWNGDILHQPALITRPTSNEDVAAAIAFARTHGLDLSVRGGGHGYAGKAVVEKGLVIDLSRLDDVRVEPGVAAGPRRRRRCVGSRRRGDHRARARGHRRNRQPHRGGRADAGWRAGLAHVPAGPQL